MQVLCPVCREPQVVADDEGTITLSCTSCGHSFSTTGSLETYAYVPPPCDVEDTAPLVPGKTPSQETSIRADSQRSAQPASAPQLGAFAGYELLEEIARGGMGVVYKARQRSITSLTAGNTWTVAGGNDGDLRFLKNGKYHSTIKGPGGKIAALALSADEKFVVLGTETGALRIVAVPRGDTIADLPEHELAITSLALSSDGATLITASNDQVAQIWRRQREGYQRYVRLPLDGRDSQIRLSPNGAKLALFGKGHTGVRIWRFDRLTERFQNLGIPEG